MAAIDTFDWYIAMLSQQTGSEVRAAIRAAREAFEELRSEDERERFVEEVIERFHATASRRP